MNKDFRFEHILMPTFLVDRDKFILNKIKDKYVLHLGCSDQYFTSDKMLNNNLLHLQLCKYAKHIDGVDYDEAGIMIMKNNGIHNLFIGNVEQLSSINGLGHNYEIIIAGEIIEHLLNPGRFLSEAYKILSDDGELIITTPNSLCWKNSFFAFFDRESIHPDHTLSYSPMNIRTVLAKTGLEIHEIYIYQNGGNCVCIRDNMGKKEIIKRSILNCLGSIMFLLTKKRPYIGDGIIVVAKKITK